MEVETEVLPEVTSTEKTKEKSPTPPLQDLPKKSKNDKSKRDDRSADQFMKSLSSAPNTDEKLSLACKKYVQAAEDNKKLQFYIKQSDKRYTLLSKEKDQLQHEYNKTVLVKSKLENLCRELQKQNKSIKDESLTKIREEEERRKETQAKFQNTLSEITTLLQQNNEKNAKLRDDNVVITEKFKSVVQQYQLREQQVDKMAKQMTLESQLSDAKLQKASLEHQADKERLMAEREQLKVSLAQYRAKILELQGIETSLKGQISIYTAKYDEFQNALVKSNQVFGGFKEQIEKMSKKIQKLEKESLSWKKRWESSQTALLDMCGERQSAERRLVSLQGLCRTLQAERVTLLNSLKEHNIERPPLPPPVPPQQAVESDDKVEAMAANCAQLKQSIAQLQNQLNVFTNKKEEEPKPVKPKKSKAKRNKAAQKEKSVEPAPAINTSAPEVSNLSTDNIVTSNEPEVESTEEKIDVSKIENLMQVMSVATSGLADLTVENLDSDKPNGIMELPEIIDDINNLANTKNSDIVVDVETKPEDAETCSNEIDILKDTNENSSNAVNSTEEDKLISAAT